MTDSCLFPETTSYPPGFLSPLLYLTLPQRPRLLHHPLNGMAVIQDLPIEILYKILELGSVTSDAYDRRGLDYGSLSLVCRAWTAIALSLLVRTIGETNRCSKSVVLPAGADEPPQTVDFLEIRHERDRTLLSLVAGHRIRLRGLRIHKESHTQAEHLSPSLLRGAWWRTTKLPRHSRRWLIMPFPSPSSPRALVQPSRTNQGST